MCHTTLRGMKFHALLCVLHLIIHFNNFTQAYKWTEESLRDSIKNLLNDKFTSTDGKEPYYEEKLSDTTPKNKSQYDFIIIGAGAAGATIASRLSEIENITVLLIEAGSEELPIMNVPGIAEILLTKRQLTWTFNTESSNKSCLGFVDSKCYLRSGKVVGGSSTINFMVAQRGSRKDYDEWARMTNDDSWSFKKMLKYFKKLENFSIKGVGIQNEFRSKNGPIPITTSSYHTELGKAFIDAGKEMGYPEVEYNGLKQNGFSYFQSTIGNGERFSTNRAYLHSARKRKNLFLTRNSLVNKILINKKTKTAYGVNFSKFSKNFEIYAKKEIILCAGALKSPQILMLSGVGPAHHLRDLEIDVIKDSPVGQSIMDIVGYFGISFETNGTYTPSFDYLDPKNPSIRDYVKKRSGPLILSASFEALSRLNIEDKYPSNDDPDIQILFGYSSGLKHPLYSELFGIPEYYRAKMSTHKSNNSFWVAFPILLAPKSNGKVLLRNKDPNTRPKVYTNYLDHPDDMRRLRKGLKFVIELSKTKAFAKYGSKPYRIPSDCDHYDSNSDTYWECSIRHYSSSTLNFVGTCKMGREDDNTSVVNSKLQVIGIKKLRVVDSSVIPKLLHGHMHISVIATAEKISDTIKEDLGYKID